ncbi:MAG: Asp-tRNA(Asn)/Glu-tRNA(Gln) amidotransferase subunit GatA [Gammaproteobacteria bacterium]|nr:Asp-tRNA(Asn)/Glu-tRNA(Gln) amidotransferase subunit GatA [Gammaproteobacteria bacterium]
MHKKTIAELANDLKNKKISAVELTQHFIDRIKKLDTKLNAFITLAEEKALKDAKRADEMIGNGKATALTGIPIAHKDLFCTQNIKTTAGSKILSNFIPPYDATVVKKLDQAGTILLGKTNCDEFAMGSSNKTSFYGRVNNPWDVNTVPGGSSGGSAAAVAARMLKGATGTDTGGSIRQPAALSGITGIKPTYGRVSRYGIVALGSSLDQAGILTPTAEDAALLLEAISGFDEKDSTSVDQPVPHYYAHLNDSVKGLRIGLPKECFTKDLDAEIANSVYQGAKVLEKLGATLHDISLPRSQLGIPIYYVIMPAECSSNLARYDGVRFGYRCENPKDLNDLYERTRSEGFGDEVKHRIMIGTYVLSASYYDAYYKKAQQLRRLIYDDYQNAFKEVDIILYPTSPSVAFKHGEKENRISMYLADIFTVTLNLAGLPGISIPSGFKNGLPIGLQLIGNHFEETKLLNVAHQYQKATDWHTQIPKGFE